MNTIINKVSVIFLMVLSITVVNAQDEAGGLSFSGSVDAYYRANLNSSNNASDSVSSLAPVSSFANNPGFAIGMANLIAAYEGEKVGAVADLVFGPRGADAVFLSGPANNIVNQLYVYWNMTDALTLTLGNFNTFLGYEVISPTGNFNYSTSYMFSYGPFSHTGLKLDVDLGNGLSVMGAIMNPTDATEFNPSDDYVGGVQVGYTNDMGGAWLNALISDGFYQVDLTTGWDLSDAIYVGVNATSSSDFLGAAAYFQVATSDALKLGLRGEYFSDDSGVAITAGESVIDVTLSANYTVGNLTFIPEFRLDALSYDGFTYSDDFSGTPPSYDVGSSLSSFVLAAVYAF